MRAASGAAILFLIATVTGRSPGEAVAQPKIEFKSRELQEGRNYLQQLIGNVAVMGSGGSLSYDFPLTAPSGRGMTPSLGLVYSSSAEMSEYGYGWDLTLPMLERNSAEGVPQFDDSDVFQYRQGFDRRPLVATGEITADGWAVFREETERTFSRYLLKSNSWRILSLDGKRLELGTGSDSRRGRGTRSVLADTAAWMPKRSIDTHGNFIVYEYWSDRVGQSSVYVVSILSCGKMVCS